MKKLIIALAVATMAGMVNAACCAWQFKTTTSVAGLEGSTAYVILGDYGATAPKFTALSEITSIAYDAAGSATSTKTKPSYSTSAAGGIDSASLTASTPNFYLVLVNDAKSSYWVSDVFDATPNLYEAGSAQAGTLSIAPASIGAFTPMTSPTPEPTSGILMLLGMAGLALKRKRA